MARKNTRTVDEPGERARDIAAEWVALDSLRPWPGNPRRNDGAPVDAVAASIIRLGWGAPLVTRMGELVAGHTRLKAAAQLRARWDAATAAERKRWHPEARRVAAEGVVPARARDDLSEGDARMLALADNRTAELATWDGALLSEILGELSPDDAGIAGWDGAALSEIADALQPPTDADWADAFEQRGDTSLVDDLKQLTFVLPGIEYTMLCARLKALDSNKNKALILWLHQT